MDRDRDRESGVDSLRSLGLIKAISEYRVKYDWCVMHACGAVSLRSCKSLILVVRLIFREGWRHREFGCGG